MIVIEHLEKSFGQKILFQDFDLTVKDGEFIVIAGKSGCGKTTLLNMLGGIENIDGGEIIVDNLKLTDKKNVREYFLYKVGFLFQNFALVDNKTVEENLNFVQKKSRMGYSVEDVLKTVGLEDKMKEKVYKLSGGEQQRVALARLMYKKCDLILADEPTGSLDRENTEMVLQILHHMNEQGKTVVLVTHDERIIETEKRVVWL